MAQDPPRRAAGTRPHGPGLTPLAVQVSRLQPREGSGTPAPQGGYASFSSCQDVRAGVECPDEVAGGAAGQGQEAREPIGALAQAEEIGADNLQLGAGIGLGPGGGL